ncbi:hypothetical protein Mmc1_3370 [Magnetococcus marinus MC-1]|uniref:Uncharacterized protein n=1 Tax=Magnetococcus marinus (strain ATCC BAA-1437 / JCM 17883 / MC-1) TaxID=156889 RepID=A0LD13_MAGMM|nr:hypothetical protein [Magnetococcus marinus]ABK45856.1 hypothetical protein Mmc1_3370 [Magnetococcus marinus MC-1]
MRALIAVSFAALLLVSLPAQAEPEQAPAQAEPEQAPAQAEPEPPVFCVQNALAARIHVQALDSSPFEGDIAAGAHLCCSKVQCSKTITPLIVMSGYIPLSNSAQAGWKSDCRVKAHAGRTIRITGILEKILCAP